jgi:hypothetical protein
MARTMQAPATHFRDNAKRWLHLWEEGFDRAGLNPELVGKSSMDYRQCQSHTSTDPCPLQ